MLSKLQGTFGEWKIRDSETRKNDVHYSCCPNPYQHVTTKFTLERKIHSWTWVIGIPFIGKYSAFIIYDGSNIYVIFDTH